MSAVFDTVHNHLEHLVIEAVSDYAADYPEIGYDAHADVACIALNRLPPRYIRHKVDMVFYQTEADRARTEEAVTNAVKSAFMFLRERERSGQRTGT